MDGKGAEISDLVITSLPYLIVLFESKNKVLTHSLLDNKKVINSLSEIIYNLLLSNFNLSDQEKRRLKRHKKYLYILGKKQHLKQKRGILKSQQGGGVIFSVLSTTLAPILLTLKQNGSANHRE